MPYWADALADDLEGLLAHEPIVQRFRDGLESAANPLSAFDVR